MKSPTRLDDVRFADPGLALRALLRLRCRSRITPDDSPDRWGRCELPRGHIGPHAIDYGMTDLLWESPATMPGRRLEDGAPSVHINGGENMSDEDQAVIGDLVRMARERVRSDGCQVPPPGWWCSREPGHDGPCCARPDAPALRASQDRGAGA